VSLEAGGLGRLNRGTGGSAGGDMKEDGRRVHDCFQNCLVSSVEYFIILPLIADLKGLTKVRVSKVLLIFREWLRGRRLNLY
jgi:hypothetical protein